MKDIHHCLAPTPSEQVARVIGDLRMGLPCLLRHGSDRWVIGATESLQEARFQAVAARFGAPEMLITAERAAAIMTGPAASAVTGPVARIRPPLNAASDWYQTQADPRCDRPGLPAGPFHLLTDRGDTPHTIAIQLVKRAELLPSAVVFPVAPDDPLADVAFATLDTGAAQAVLLQGSALTDVARASLPLAAHDDSQLHVFRDPDGRTEHYAVEIGGPDRTQPVLARLHSACFTGDVLGSLKCDCGPQLRTALTRMGEEGSGVLLYLNQEGRGIGLANKMRVYDLQAQGFDTVEANHRLGFKDDERDFRVGATMLRTLGFSAIRLLTNNPAKVDTFNANGITVTAQLPLRTATNMHNQNYLAVKARKSGHLL